MTLPVNAAERAVADHREVPLPVGDPVSPVRGTPIEDIASHEHAAPDVFCGAVGLLSLRGWPGDSVGLPVAPRQQVVLHHCGVQSITYESRSWEVEDPPFDQTNAPDSFSGYGKFERKDDTLLFADGEGARLTFVIDDGTPNPYNCG